MELTFILGNGFDKAIGLNTGYGDFYAWYSKQTSENSDVSLLKDTIRGNETTTWADFEIGLGRFTEKFTDAKRFIDCFTYARSSLIQYLNNEYSNAIRTKKDFLQSATYVLVKLSQRADSDLTDNDKKKFSILKSEPMTFNCISFNYTPVLRDGWEEMERNAGAISSRDGWYGNYSLGEMLNVHGLLDDNPILGVDNPSQIANESFRNNEEILQMMVKGEIDKKLGKRWREQALSIIRRSQKIYVYGSSLGDTDEFWWKALAQWFEADITHQLALYSHPKATKEEMVLESERVINNISKHLKNKKLQANIVIDNIKKNMTVGFVYAAGNITITSSATANAVVVKIQE